MQHNAFITCGDSATDENPMNTWQQHHQQHQQQQNEQHRTVKTELHHVGKPSAGLPRDHVLRASTYTSDDVQRVITEKDMSSPPSFAFTAATTTTTATNPSHMARSMTQLAAVASVVKSEGEETCEVDHKNNTVVTLTMGETLDDSTSLSREGVMTPAAVLPMPFNSSTSSSFSSFTAAATAAAARRLEPRSSSGGLSTAATSLVRQRRNYKAVLTARQLRMMVIGA